MGHGDDRHGLVTAVLMVCLAQLLPGMILVFRVSLLTMMGWSTLLEGCQRKKDDRELSHGKKADDSGDSSQTDMTDDIPDGVHYVTEIIHRRFLEKEAPELQKKSAIVSALEERQKHIAWQEARREAFERNRCIFCSHTRTEQNFMRGSDDPQTELPPSSPMEIEAPYYTRMVLYGYLRQGYMYNVFLMSLGWSLMAGSLGTLICLYHHVDVGSGKEWVEHSQYLFGKVLADFKWLPTFMLAAHLGFYVQRWRQFIFAAWGVEGRLKDLGIIIGSDVKDPDDPASRRLMFKIYRYMVLSMALQYKSILPPLKEAGPHLCRMLERLGLLTPQEVPVLAPQGSRMRDAVLSWIALEVKDNGPAKTGLLYGNCEISVMDKLTALRAKMMYFHGNAFYPQPNQWAAFMNLLIDMYCGLMIMIYPFKMLTPLELTRIHGFQPLTVACVFVMTLCYWGAMSMCYAFSTPFAGRFDTFNIDALIAGTEQTLFASMRAGFDSASRKQRPNEAPSR